MPSSEPNAPRAPRWRWAAAAGAAGLLLAAIALWGGARLLSAGGLKPWLEREAQRYTGLDLEIGGLAVHWGWRPRIVARDLRMGDGPEFHAEATRIEARLRAAPLLRGAIVIEEIAPEGVSVYLPGDPGDLAARWSDLMDHIRGAQRGGRGRTAIRAITAMDGRIHLGGELAARVDLTLRDVLSDQITAEALAALPFFGPDAEGAAELAIARARGAPAEVTGAAVFRSLAPPSAWLAIPEALPAYTADLECVISGAAPDMLHFAIEGRAHAPDLPEASGPIQADLFYRHGQLDLNDFTLAAPGLQIIADLTRQPGGALACQVRRAAVDAPVLDAAVSGLAPMGYTITPHDGARLTLIDFMAGTRPDGSWRFIEGEAAFHGADLRFPDGSAAARDISGRVRVDEGRIVLDEVAGPEIALRGIVTPGTAPGRVHVALSGNGPVTREQLAAFLPMDRVAALQGQVALEELDAVFRTDGGPPESLRVAARFSEVRLTAEAPGLDAPIALAGIEGGLRFEEGALRLDAVKGAGFSLDGVVHPGAAGADTVWDLSGTAALDSGLAALALPFEGLRVDGGTIAFTRIAGRWPSGAGAPAELVAEGRVTDGAAAIETPGYSDALSGVEATFNTSDDSVTAELRMNSQKFGALSAQGAYAIAAGTFEGGVTLDAARAVGAFVDSAEARAWSNALLAPHRNASFSLTLTLPETPGAPYLVEARRTGGPRLNARAELRPGAAEGAIESLRIEADAGAQALVAQLPARLEADGTAAVTLTRAAGSERFQAAADFTNARVGLPPMIEKPRGIAASVAVEGAADAAGWRPGKVALRVAGEEFHFVPAHGGMSAENLRIDLGALRALLPEGGGADGVIHARFHTAPPSAELRFEGVRIGLAPGLALDQVDGTIARQGDYWSFHGLTLRGANSDFTVNAGLEDGVWQGRLEGQQLDLDAVLAMQETWRGIRGEPADAPFRGPGMRGALAINIAGMRYRRARLTDVRATLRMTPEAYLLEDLRLGLGAGEAEGRARIAAGPGGRAMADTELTLRDADLRVVERLIFAEARGMHGALSGRIAAAFPTGGARAALSGLSGSARLEARDGSYGTLGWATHLLSLARNVEVFYLRAPSLRDSGLAFELSRADLTAENGVLQVREFGLATKTYGLDAHGLVDFPRDATDLTARMYLFESVTGILGTVPVLGGAIDRIKRLTALPIRITGPPFEPQFGQAREAGVEITPAEGAGAFIREMHERADP